MNPYLKEEEGLMASQISMGLHSKGATSLKQSQRLMMSPQMQQAIYLLQVPVNELAQVVQRELEQNPILEYLEPVESEEFTEDLGEPREEKEIEISEDNYERINDLDELFEDYYFESYQTSNKKHDDDDKSRSFIEQSVIPRKTLYVFLTEQVSESFESEEDKEIAYLIIGNLDHRGYLDTSIEEIAGLHGVEESKLLQILEEIQNTFDPGGVGAKNEQESLLIQLKRGGKENSLAYRIAQNCFDDLIHNRLPMLKKKLKVPLKDIQLAIEKDLLNLDLRPGMDLFSDPTQYITADVRVIPTKNGMKVVVNEEGVPHVKMNKEYTAMLDSKKAKNDVKDYIQQKISSGKWLMRNISQRNDTLYRVASSLVGYQHAFFNSIKGKLQPLTMKMVAEELELHESTVARAVANKYMDTSKGIYPLRYFFTNGYETSRGEEISSQTVKDALFSIIDGEDKKNPYSDESISKTLKGKDMECARRTVAKYRREVHIGTASQRRSYR